MLASEINSQTEPILFFNITFKNKTFVLVVCNFPIYIYIFTAASFPEMSIVKKDACLRAKNGQKLDRESLHGVVQPTFHKLPATIY